MKYRPQEEHEKAFCKLFDQLTYSRSSWQVWEDLMTVMACSIANAGAPQDEKWKKREELYKRAISDLGDPDIPAKIFGEVIGALEDKPDQDFLGALYMNLNLGSHWHGQFFTPYNICHMMAKMQMEDAKARIDEQGWISVCDTCIGGGAMLIAAANVLKEQGINYHNHVLFVGQDLDPVVAKMAYIQLSLLGCPGYIAIGDSLTTPMTGHPLFPEDREGLEYWITPFFRSDAWEYRKLWIRMDRIFAKPKKQFTFYFDFGKEEPYVGSSIERAG